MNHNGAGQAASSQSSNIVVPFLLGTVVGGVAGAVAGTLLCHRSTGLAAAVLDIIDRRLNDDDQERLRFDLLLQ
jgi:hypothetical protein